MDRLVDEFLEPPPRPVDAHQLDQGALAATRVLAGRLAQLGTVGGDVEQIVSQLERKPDGGAEAGEPGPVLLAGISDDRAGLAGEA